MLGSKEALSNVAENVPYLKAFLERHNTRSFFITNRLLPSPSGTVSVIFLYCRVLPPSPSFDALESASLSSDSEGDSRLKYMAYLPTAPYVVKASVKALGGEKPVIMGKVRETRDSLTTLLNLEAEKINTPPFAHALSLSLSPGLPHPNLAPLPQFCRGLR